jgi:serine phosphatase RsbU (regulator of sigma subunit)
MEILTYIANGFTFSLLIIFAYELAGLQKIRTRWKLLLTLVSVAGFLGASRIDHFFWLRVDMWSDFLGAGLSVPLCLAGLIVAHKNKRSHIDTSKIMATESEGGINDARMSHALLTARIVLVLLAVGLHAWANGTDLFLVQAEAFRNTLGWKHTALLPCLVTAALLEVGSTAKKMLTFGKEMAAKALIERELSVGKEVQHRMLPQRRKESQLWQWRSVYFPAQALAGDWYDVREIRFADGRLLLAACVADVTGHGVGSSLATSVICSHWSLWCMDASSRNAPSSPQDRETLLVTAPKRVNDGLLALPQNEQCTAIFALIDAQACEITFCAGGHPGIIVSDGKTLRYLTSQGERLGATEVESPVWNAKTEALLPGETACIYSDGIIPPGDTISSYAAGLRRKLKKKNEPLLPILWKQFRENRRAFRADHEIEDDMTLLAVELKTHAVGVGTRPLEQNNGTAA